MRETADAFRARTGLAYRPPPRVPDGGRPLRPDEPCPTLFRYPGPEALAATLARGLAPLAPASAEWIWMSDDPLAAAPGPVRRFGSLVILQPLRLGPAVVEISPRSWVAAPQACDEELVVWLPPSRLDAAWDDVADATQARALLGPTDDERAAVLDVLGAYLEELASLARAGATPPRGAWCDVDPAARARILADHGIESRFTAR